LAVPAQPTAGIFQDIQTFQFGSLALSGVFDIINSILETVDDVEVRENPHFSFPPIARQKKSWRHLFYR
jgi:hypothetical protein